MQKTQQPRNRFTVIFFRLLIWLNWEREWEWLSPFTQFPRSLDLLRDVAQYGIEDYPEVSQPSWRRWGDQDVDLPGSPENKILFAHFLARLKELSVPSRWWQAIRIIESARQGKHALLRIQLEVLGIPPTSLEDALFFPELARWLASFLPMGKPVIKPRWVLGKTWMEMHFPNGSKEFIGAFSATDTAGETFCTPIYQTLIDKAPDDAHFYGGNRRGIFQIFRLNKHGWAEGVTGESGEPMEFGWGACDSPLAKE